jgi:hypothetical protein
MMRYFIHIDGETSPRAGFGYATVAEAIAAAHALGYEAGSYWVVPRWPDRTATLSVIETG